MRRTDLLAEAAAGALSRPSRAAFTMLGTALGIGALVAVIGISQTAGNQLLLHFDELTATEVVVRTNVGAAEGGAQSDVAADPIPDDAEARIQGLNGVRVAGVLGEVDTAGAAVRSVRDGLGGVTDVAIHSATPGTLEALRGDIFSGRWFDDFAMDSHAQVAVLGPGASATLHISRIRNLPAIFIEDTAFLVIGIVRDVERGSEILDSVIIPRSTANELFQVTNEQVVVDTEIGFAQLIGTQVPTVLSPNDPSRLIAEVPPDPVRQRTAAAADVNLLFIALGLVSLVVGALGIANVTLMSVIERTGEVGLRRALGATRRSIVRQFLIESLVLGLLGGVVGTSVGVIAIVCAAAVKDWAPLLDLRIIVLAPFAGAAVGVLAGIYPARSAGMIAPAQSVRAGMG